MRQTTHLFKSGFTVMSNSVTLLSGCFKDWKMGNTTPIRHTKLSEPKPQDNGHVLINSSKDEVIYQQNVLPIADERNKTENRFCFMSTIIVNIATIKSIPQMRSNLTKFQLRIALSTVIIFQVFNYFLQKLHHFHWEGLIMRSNTESGQERYD